MFIRRILYGALGLCLAAWSTWAAENGNTQYGLGASQFYGGLMAPEPGLYGLSQTSYYFADRLNDKNGNRIPVDFDVKAAVETLRFLGVTDVDIAGGNLWFQGVLPYMVDLNASAGPFSDSRGGIADIVAATGLHWQAGPHSFLLGLDVAMPTGSYDAQRLSNPGLNHWSVQPAAGYHYLDFQNPTWELGLAARYIHNFENHDTNYTSGDEFNIDYAIGYNFGKLRVGMTGYFLKQLEDDKGPGVGSDGNRGQVFAMGPSINWKFTQFMEVNLAYQKEFFVRNRAAGNTIWLNATLPF